MCIETVSHTNIMSSSDLAVSVIIKKLNMPLPSHSCMHNIVPDVTIITVKGQIKTGGVGHAHKFFIDVVVCSLYHNSHHRYYYRHYGYE